MMNLSGGGGIVGMGTFAGQQGVGSSSGMTGEREVVRNTGKQAIMSFLETQTCYSVLRASGKVVVFDTRIPIQLAFYALVEHGEIDSYFDDMREEVSCQNFEREIHVLDSTRY